MSTLVPALSSRPSVSVGTLLRAWRHRRRRSQLDLALDADVSARHVSFIESGRSAPSRDMLLRLAEMLDVPLRERNALLLADGFAPVYRERRLDDPDMHAVDAIVRTILHAHHPHPALAVDRHWTLMAANDAVAPLMAGVADPALLRPPINVLRVSLHPDGLAPRIANLPIWRAHILDRLRRQAAVAADPVLDALLAELITLGAGPINQMPNLASDIAVPLEFDTDLGRFPSFLQRRYSARRRRSLSRSWRLKRSTLLIPLLLNGCADSAEHRSKQLMAGTADAFPPA